MKRKAKISQPTYATFLTVDIRWQVKSTTQDGIKCIDHYCVRRETANLAATIAEIQHYLESQSINYCNMNYTIV